MQVDILKKKMKVYLTFDDSVNEYKSLLKKYTDIWDGFINQIKAINGGEENNYEKRLHEN